MAGCRGEALTKGLGDHCQRAGCGHKTFPVLAFTRLNAFTTTQNGAEWKRKVAVPGKEKEDMTLPRFDRLR